MAGEPAPAPADTGPAYDALNIGSLSGQLGAEMQRGDQLEAERTKALEPMRNEMKATLEKQGSRPPPELKPGPQLSPQAIHKDANDFVDTAILLGAIGGLLSRAPLIGAMNAFSGAMSGFREGDDARVKSELETFNAQVKAVKEQNTELLDRYKLILDNDKLEVNAKLNLLEITANQYNDPIMASQARAKNLSTLIQLADRREVAGARMGEASARLELSYARMEQQRGFKEQELELKTALAAHKELLDAGKMAEAEMVGELVQQKASLLDDYKQRAAAIGGDESVPAEERTKLLAQAKTDLDKETGKLNSEISRLSAKGKDSRPGQMGARESVFVQRMMLGANEAVRDLENVVNLPTTASAGTFGGRKQGPGLLDAARETLTTKMTSQEVQSYNTRAAGFQRNLAAIEAAGLMPSGSLTHQMEAVLFKEGDSVQTKMEKLAQTRQIIDAALDVAVANPRVSPAEKEKMESITDRLHKAVPFTIADLDRLNAAQATNPKITMRQIIDRKTGSPSAASGGDGWSVKLKQ